MAGTRSFNAINGAELKAIILKELAQELSMDPRFHRADPLPTITMAFRVRVEAYPMEPAFFAVQVSEKATAVGAVSAAPAWIVARVKHHLDLDERFNLHVTYPKVTWDWKLDVETPGLPTAPARIAGAVVDETRHLMDLSETARPVVVETPMAMTPDPRPRLVIGTPQAEPGVIVDEHGRKYRLVDEPAVASAPIAPSELRHSRLEKVTGTGLDIEAAFKPSPGPGMAASYGGGSPVGAMQGSEPVEHIELGRAHGALDEGGAGAPDAIRRDNGLPIPSAQATPGGNIVDLPAGSF